MESEGKKEEESSKKIIHTYPLIRVRNLGKPKEGDMSHGEWVFALVSNDHSH